ncbi:hypothetical protein SDJN03_26036, partial [Cucurbita argyrosperma subsp. sororia]
MRRLLAQKNPKTKSAVDPNWFRSYLQPSPPSRGEIIHLKTNVIVDPLLFNPALYQSKEIAFIALRFSCSSVGSSLYLM